MFANIVLLHNFITWKQIFTSLLIASIIKLKLNYREITFTALLNGNTTATKK